MVNPLYILHTARLDAGANLRSGTEVNDLQGGPCKAREQELGWPPGQTHGMGYTFAIPAAKLHGVSAITCFRTHPHEHWAFVDFMHAPLGATCPSQGTQASAAPSYHVLQYKYVPDILEKRGPHREAHLGAARQKVHCPCQDTATDGGWCACP